MGMPNPKYRKVDVKSGFLEQVPPPPPLPPPPLPPPLLTDEELEQPPQLHKVLATKTKVGGMSNLIERDPM
jgi:hypothetical protein